MKTILFIFLIFLGISLNAQIPTTFNLRGGDSEIKGVAGAEFQLSNYSIAAGWRPVYNPMGGYYNSFSGALTAYTNQWYNSSWYLSAGAASKGCLYSPTVHNPIISDDFIPEPTLIFMGGRRFNFYDLNREWDNKYIIDAGVGYAVSEHNHYITFELIFNFVLLDNNKK
jgi:hypothetical protein